VPPGVDQQRAVTVPGQHRGLPEHRGAGGPGAGQQHHGGAIARRDVPGRQAHPVRGAERHILIAEPVACRGGRSQRARRTVGRVDRHGQRQQHELQQHQRRRHGQQPPPARRRPNQHRDSPNEQDDTGHQHDDRHGRRRVQPRFRQVRAGRTRAGDGARDPERQSRRDPAGPRGPAGEPDGPGGHHDDQQHTSRLPCRGAVEPGQHGESRPLGSNDGWQHDRWPGARRNNLTW